MLNYQLVAGRFTSTDALWEKYPGWSPYQYSLNNPINMLDWNGKDAEQRQKAIDLARKYMKEKGSTYKMAAKGEPGKPVDCSGMVSNCIVAGGEPNPVLSKETKGTGVQKIEQGTQQISEDEIVEGSIVTFRTGGDWPFHVGIVSEVIRDEDNNVIKFKYIHANSTNNGVTESKETSINDKKVFGFFKWDTIPDKKSDEINIIKGQTDDKIPPTIK